MAYITATGLSIGYDNKEILSDLNFEVRPGDYLCIVGANGAGKSTLVKTILGILPPLKGTICRGDGLNANEIGYLPQQTPVQKDFPASVEEIVLSGCQGRMGLRPFYSRKDRSLAWENMERMQIASLAQKSYRNLSGGQQQRVLLARALCATGKLLLLDEPVAGLDPMVTVRLYELVEELNREGMTVIMVSHDMDAALRYAGHILHVDRQRFFGTKEEYRQSDIGRKFLSQQNPGRES